MMKVSIVFGTRPEAIKLAPLIQLMKKRKNYHTNVCVTAQHRHMLDQVLSVFNIVPDIDLDIMRPNQGLADLTARGLKAINNYLRSEKPDLVIVQGDTTTTLATALAAFYNRIPLCHVEAGLRTFDINSPWPEEANRILTSRLTTLHFAPTEGSKTNLLKEGINPNQIFVTGNTVIDALLIAVKNIRASSALHIGIGLNKGAKIILITGHRRENIGKGFISICKAIIELARLYPKNEFVYPVHLNPNVRATVMGLLSEGHGKSRLPNIHLVDPLPYLEFVRLMNRSYIILTDSGGIQEEAPSLGKPVLVMRDTTERPEAIEAGTVKLVGTKTENIVNQVVCLMKNKKIYNAMAQTRNPYGDGKAAERIIKGIESYFQ
jgi:UDP-N-acetylglucosamine 2-epimerase (non-hydrolysing)